MARKRRSSPTTTARLNDLLDKIEDEKIKEIVKEVVSVEISYRSSSRKNFPVQRIRDIIEGAVK
jgi:hypothetical protein